MDELDVQGKIFLTQIASLQWLCAEAETRLPQDLLAVEKPDRFSFSRSRLALERLYVLLPPSLLETILAGNIVNLYRWKDPLRTLKWATVSVAAVLYADLTVFN